jgi:hypothetical protein
MLKPVAPERSVPFESAVVRSIGTPTASSAGSVPVSVVDSKAELVTALVDVFVDADGLMPSASSEASDAGLREARELII